MIILLHPQDFTDTNRVSKNKTSEPPWRQQAVSSSPSERTYWKQQQASWPMSQESPTSDNEQDLSIVFMIDDDAEQY